MTQGYFIVPRSILDSTFWQLDEPLSKEGALIELISMASYADRKLVINGEEVAIPRGTVALSQVKLATKWQWTRQAVHRFLKRLEKYGHIRIENYTVMTLITFTDLLNFSGSKVEKASELNVRQVGDKSVTSLRQVGDNNFDEIREVISPSKTDVRQVGDKSVTKPGTKEVINNKLIINKREEEGCGEKQNSSLPLVEHPPQILFSDENEVLAPETAVPDEFPTLETPQIPPEKPTETPQEWPDNPTESALFMKKDLPVEQPKAAKKPRVIEEKPPKDKIEVRLGVWLTKDEIARFKQDFPDKSVRDYYASMLSDYKLDNPNWAKKRRCDNRTMRNWIRRDQTEQRAFFKPKPAFYKAQVTSTAAPIKSAASWLNELSEHKKSVENERKEREEKGLPSMVDEYREKLNQLTGRMRQ